MHNIKKLIYEILNKNLITYKIIDFIDNNITLTSDEINNLIRLENKLSDDISKQYKELYSNYKAMIKSVDDFLISSSNETDNDVIARLRNKVLIFAKSNNIYIGYIVYSYKNKSSISDIYIEPKYRGLKIAKTFFDMIEKIAKSKGHNDISVKTIYDSIPYKIYKKYGYSIYSVDMVKKI